MAILTYGSRLSGTSDCPKLPDPVFPKLPDPTPFAPKPCPALLTAVFRHTTWLSFCVCGCMVNCLRCQHLGLVLAITCVTIIGLASCLYDGFMDEESSSTAIATAAEESSSQPGHGPPAKAGQSAPCQCALFLVPYMPLSIDQLQQLMLQLLSLFGSYFSKLILLFSVYIGCFTATAKIIREIMDILIHYNSIRNKAG